MPSIRLWNGVPSTASADEGSSADGAGTGAAAAISNTSGSARRQWRSVMVPIVRSRCRPARPAVGRCSRRARPPRAGRVASPTRRPHRRPAACRRRASAATSGTPPHPPATGSAGPAPTRAARPPGGRGGRPCGRSAGSLQYSSHWNTYGTRRASSTPIDTSHHCRTNGSASRRSGRPISPMYTAGRPSPGAAPSRSGRSAGVGPPSSGRAARAAPSISAAHVSGGIADIVAGPVAGRVASRSPCSGGCRRGGHPLSELASVDNRVYISIGRFVCEGQAVSNWTVGP